MEPKFVTARGVRFAYLEQGTGPLVLLVHGFPDTAYTWDATLPALAGAGFRAVAPFTRGYFPTEVPSDGKYDTESLASDLLALIEALGEKQAILVGHDWGAEASYAATALGPEKVRLLVTVAIPHPGGVRMSPRLVWALRHFFVLGRKSGPAKVRANDFALVDTLFRRWSPAWKDVPASETAHVKEAFARPGVVEAACAYYRQAGFTISAIHKRNKIVVPSVAFAGEHDMVPTRWFEKVRHKYTKSYEVVQVPGGHFMHREHPDHFVPELVRVLQDHAARG